MRYQNIAMINMMRMDLLFVILNYLIDLNILNDNSVEVINDY